MLPPAERPLALKETHSLPVTLVFFFLLATGLLADTDVTSREQFGRLLPGGLPKSLHYNDDRAWLELRTDEKNCPSLAHLADLDCMDRQVATNSQTPHVLQR